MAVVSFVNFKGGVGKSTLAVAYAATAAAAGETVIILDVDVQESAVNWAGRREADNPSVMAVTPGKLRQTIEQAQANGADLIIIDTPGRNAAVSVDAARLSDLVLIPSRPLPFDTDTLPKTRQIISRAGEPPSFVVWNCVHPQGQAYIDNLKSHTLAGWDLEPCPIHVTQRSLFPQSQARGLAPNEVDKDNRATAEMQWLYLFTVEQIKKAKGSKNNGKQQSKNA